MYVSGCEVSAMGCDVSLGVCHVRCVCVCVCVRGKVLGVGGVTCAWCEYSGRCRLLQHVHNTREAVRKAGLPGGCVLHPLSPLPLLSKDTPHL